jgi:hypothetical protein
MSRLSRMIGSRVWSTESSRRTPHQGSRLRVSQVIQVRQKCMARSRSYCRRRTLHCIERRLLRTIPYITTSSSDWAPRRLSTISAYELVGKNFIISLIYNATRPSKRACVLFVVVYLREACVLECVSSCYTLCNHHVC